MGSGGWASVSSVGEVQIRPSRQADAESIAAHIKTANTPGEICEEIALYEARRGQGYEHLVAVDGDEVVGNIALIPSRYFPTGQSHRCEFADIVVARTYRGTGLLRRLVEAAAGRARALGYTQVETSTWGNNDRAVNALRGVGFRDWGRLPNARLCDDGHEDLVCFVMTL